MQKTLGGDRIGSGKKMQVHLHGYERSTHDLGYLWRSTMSAGTLVPFLTEVALPGDTFDIDLDCDIKTHPTVGPLFGSFKVQLDVYQCPIRLYQGQLHNNKLGIGMNMSNVKLPQMTLYVDPAGIVTDEDPDNAQINPSCILSYLGIRGVGMIDAIEVGIQPRLFNALPLLSYWDIVKNYYSNKQESNGWVIHEQKVTLIQTVTLLQFNGQTLLITPLQTNLLVENNYQMVLDYTGTIPNLQQIIINTTTGQYVLSALIKDIDTSTAGTITALFNGGVTGSLTMQNWHYLSNSDMPIQQPVPTPFLLTNIDDMRELILTATQNPLPFDVTTNGTGIEPYTFLLEWGALNQTPYLNNQEGLALKTYQSDQFNNWLNTETIDGINGIAAITAIDTSGGSFTIDTLRLSTKVNNMLNRIAVSGGTYNDWLDVVYTNDRYTQAESPIYHGGLIRELVFQEVISNSESNQDVGSGLSNQPLGTLGGRGVMANKRKGGRIRIKIDEPSYIMGIISLTPRIDYSQGNKWDTQLKTMDDFHKPALDEIGFQDLILEQMAWWSTEKVLNVDSWVTKSVGKQPAWLNYMTNVNQTRGNFAIKDNEMFMTLNRRYEKDGGTLSKVKDVTTYIDPNKYNQIFAETSIDAMNYWAQISVDITARRKMSAKIMPNL